ncbi:hypothetical protein RA281_27680, partial [Pseudomonas syringae pv. tagetis]
MELLVVGDCVFCWVLLLCRLVGGVVLVFFVGGCGVGWGGCVGGCLGGGGRGVVVCFCGVVWVFGWWCGGFGVGLLFFISGVLCCQVFGVSTLFLVPTLGGLMMLVTLGVTRRFCG